MRGGVIHTSDREEFSNDEIASNIEYSIARGARSNAPHPPRACGARHPLPASRGEGWEYAARPAAISLLEAASPHHQRSGAMVGEQLEQHRVRHTAIENDHALDAGVERVEAGFDLGDHAARDGAIGD